MGRGEAGGAGEAARLRERQTPHSNVMVTMRCQRVSVRLAASPMNNSTSYNSSITEFSHS